LQAKADIQKIIGINIAKIRQSKNLTQIALGDLLDIERQSINRIEKGRTNISIHLLYKIACALEVKIEILFENIYTV
jgi:transcriptional regulator with XRE-family HTH domain